MSSDEKICASVRARFSELVEGDLGDEARREAEAHLAGCVECAASLARFREAIAALGRLSRPEPPADLPDRIDRALDRLDRAAAPAGRPPGRRRMVRHAVAALLVCGIVVGIIRVVPEVSGPLPARRADAPAPAAPREAFEDGEQPLPALDRAAPALEEEAARESGARERKAAPPRPEAAGPPVGTAQGMLKDDAARPDADEDADEADGSVADAVRSELAKKAAPAYRADAVGQARGAAEKAAPGARSRYGQEEDAPGGAAQARAVLLAARPEAAWVAAVRDLALSRPEDLAAAWAAIDAGARESILAVWRRAEAPPGLAADLARAKDGAPTPAAREVIEALAGAARPAVP